MKLHVEDEPEAAPTHGLGPWGLVFMTVIFAGIDAAILFGSGDLGGVVFFLVLTAISGAWAAYSFSGGKPKKKGKR